MLFVARELADFKQQTTPTKEISQAFAWHRSGPTEPVLNYHCPPPFPGRPPLDMRCQAALTHRRNRPPATVPAGERETGLPKEVGTKPRRTASGARTLPLRWAAAEADLRLGSIEEQTAVACSCLQQRLDAPTDHRRSFAQHASDDKRIIVEVAAPLTMPGSAIPPWYPTPPGALRELRTALPLRPMASGGGCQRRATHAAAMPPAARCASAARRQAAHH